MKQILGNLCRTSVAAAGVMVAASAVQAESRPLDLETEFDLGHVAGGDAIQAAGTIRAGILGAPAAAAKWEESIGAYLDGLLDRVSEPAAIGQQADADPTPDVVRAEIKALDEVQTAAEKAEAPAPAPVAAAPAKDEAPVNPLLLAPVLSHPMDCELCHKELTAAAEQLKAEEPNAGQAKVDDEAAQQKLAEWATARVADDAPAARAGEEAATAEALFFTDGADDNADVDSEEPTLAD